MKYLSYSFILLLLISTTIFAQKDSVQVGMFITNLYDFDLANNCYTTEFWAWSIYKNPKYNFKDNQEISNSKTVATSNYLLEKKDNVLWEQKKYTATILHHWQIDNFPFDKQLLKISLEDAAFDSKHLHYIADAKNSKINKNLKLQEWRIDSIYTVEKNVNYNTTYGDPDLQGESNYAAVEMNIKITRLHSWNIFVKLVTGVYVAFLIALMVFRIKPPNSEGRIGLAVGGLFAAVGNKYIVEGIVPTTTSNTFIDNIHNLTFAAILIIVIRTIQVGRHYKDINEMRAEKADKLSFWGVLLGYILANIALIVHANYANG